jgi:signal transduction histidine kinase
MLFSRQDLIYRSEIQERHREISDIFRIDDLDSVLKQFCDYMAKEFEATTADLYLKSVDKISKQPHRVLRASSFPYRDPNQVLPDNQIVSVLKTGKPRIVRKQVKAPEHGDFNAASSDGLVERICIPISVGPTVQGVLSLKWDRPYDGLNWEYSSYRDEQLRVLGRVIGSAYNRFVLTQETEAERREKETAVRQRERARQRELETMDITRLLIDQRAHFTGNLVRELRGQNALMKAAESHEELRRLVFEMSDTLVEGNKAISRILEDTQIVENSEPRGHDLDLLIHATLAEVSKRCTKDPVIEVEITSNNPKVFVADLVVKHAFRNILDNAIDSIRGRDREPNATRKIYINARSMDNGMAEILFSDTGLGIKPSMIEQLNAGKVKRKGRRGFGVLTYRFFISRQGGTARFSSDGKTGASVRVELPLCLQER